MDAVYTDFEHCGFSLFLDRLIHFLTGLLYHLLDLGGMDTSVHNELLKGDPCNLTSYRIKCGKNNCIGGVVYDKLNTGHSFEGSDVSSLTSYDPSLHVLTGKLYHGNGTFSDVVRCTSLNGCDDDLPRLLVSLFLRPVLRFLDHQGFFVFQIFFNNT